MDFNFTYDIYPHPPMFCNNEKMDTMNKNILSRNSTEQEYENQLESRSVATRSFKYNNANTNNNKLADNVGHYKHYFSNIDTESELLLAKPALPQCKPKTKMTECLEDYEPLKPVVDLSFNIENPRIWNNNTKRKTLNIKKK